MFDDNPPWPTEFTGIATAGPGGDISQAMQDGVITLIATYAILYPVEALRLLEYSNTQVVRDAILERIDAIDLSNASNMQSNYQLPSMLALHRQKANLINTVGFDSLMRTTIAIIDQAPNMHDMFSDLQYLLDEMEDA
ncbi:hypothetical protein ONZ43_g2352 [Nemania bipapillata]|uniref:Uncharacterized protein n=1 Tax=Nemania bipapillata TaxID=110536 RepID=A0ACC2J0Y1_9PEZI|nr:hypothetical protein ONZ43_g2352 [Nemania bipapillata]